MKVSIFYFLFLILFLTLLKEFNKTSRQNLNATLAYLGPGILDLLIDTANDPEVC